MAASSSGSGWSTIATGEDWLIVVTTDHGHYIPSGGHGGCGIDDERRTWILAKGRGATAGLKPIDTRLVDVAPTVLSHLGLPVSATLDGKPRWGSAGEDCRNP